MRNATGLLACCCLVGCFDLGELRPIKRISTDTDVDLITETADTSTTAIEPQTFEVLIDNLAFTPDEITITAGDSIVWIMQDGGTFHFVVEGDPGGAPDFDSPRLDVGDDWIYTFDTPGEYVYHCSNHSTVMRGATVTVL
jgi:plastocyanin